MRNSSYVFLVFMFSLVFVGCERNEVAPTSVESFKSIQLPQDTPDWVKELAAYAIDNELPLEARNEQLNVYKYLTFKPELQVFLQAVDRIPGLSLLLKNQLLPVTVFAPINEAFVAFLAENGFASLEVGELPRALVAKRVWGKCNLSPKKEVSSHPL